MKIIGNGLIARSFMNYSGKNFTDLTIFASGVSNSQFDDKNCINREVSKLLLQDKNSKLIYFSTCSIYDNIAIGSPYVQHKIAMEKLVENNFKKYQIIRLPQVIGQGGNINNLINYLCTCIKNNLCYSLQKNASRNFIDVDLIPILLSSIIQGKNGITNIASPRNIMVTTVVEVLEKKFNKKSNHKLINAGSNYFIDISKIKSLNPSYHNHFRKNYFEILIDKYF